MKNAAPNATSKPRARAAGGGFGPKPIPVLVEQAYPWGNGNPRVAETFTPGSGRQHAAGRAPLCTRSLLLRLRREGVTIVGLSVGPGRIADWSVAELLAASAA